MHYLISFENCIRKICNLIHIASQNVRFFSPTLSVFFVIRFSRLTIHTFFSYHIYGFIHHRNAMVTYTTREPRHLLMSVQKEKKLGETDQIA